MHTMHMHDYLGRRRQFVGHDWMHERTACTSKTYFAIWC